ncbi:MAG: hypothetical protein AAGC74_05895 [Verrucomicrobiota bacterium]
MEILREFVRAGQNTVVLGERRMGKTSLVTGEGDEVDEVVLEQALERLLAMEKKNCEMQYKLVTGLQQRVLRALARVGGSQPQGKAFLAESGVATPASVKGALNRLVKLEMLYGPETEYKFFDPWFRLWLQRRGW